MSDRIYYRIRLDSPVMLVIKCAEERIEAYRGACDALRAEFPRSEIWNWEMEQVCGIQFAGALAPGWRKKSGKEYAVPDVRSKVGREFAARLKDLPRGVSARTFSSMLTREMKEEYEYFADNRISWTVFERYPGGIYILSVPAALKVTPPGCEELKVSEYHKICEEAAA